MARARLNDTDAVKRMKSDEIERTISTRKISNGMIECVSEYNKNTGRFVSTETYVPDPGNSAPDRSGNSLAEAKKYLGNDV